jgi:hypothetical protein
MQKIFSVCGKRNSFGPWYSFILKELCVNSNDYKKRKKEVKTQQEVAPRQRGESGTFVEKFSGLGGVIQCYVIPHYSPFFFLLSLFPFSVSPLSSFPRISPTDLKPGVHELWFYGSHYNSAGLLRSLHSFPSPMMDPFSDERSNEILATITTDTRRRLCRGT